MIEKDTVNQAIDALADSLQTRVSLTINIIRLTLAESKLAIESLILTIVLGVMTLVLLVCAWLILQMLLFAILKEHFELGSVQSLAIVLILHVVLIVTTCLVIKRLCQNLSFRHLREAIAPVAFDTDADTAETLTSSSNNNAEIENRSPQH